MLRRIAKFEKVSFEQFYEDWANTFFADKLKDNLDIYSDEWNDIYEEVEAIYNEIKLPSRMTKGSTGYSFFAPISFALIAGRTIRIPTGIRCKMNKRYGLFFFPRNSLGFEFREQIDNAFVDSIYYHNDNEGHIFAQITNNSSDKMLAVNEGQEFMQGVFLPFGITVND